MSSSIFLPYCNAYTLILGHDKPISEFFRITGPTDKKQRDDQYVTALLQQNNLVRKKIPEVNIVPLLFFQDFICCLTVAYNDRARILL